MTGWAEAIAANAAVPRTARRLIPRLESARGRGAGLLPAARGLGAGDGDAVDGSRALGGAPGGGRAGRDGARGAASARSARYLLELQPERAEGGTWFGEPGAAELVDWEPVLSRAGVVADPHRVTAAYLELAVLVRALEGLSAAVAFQASPDRGSLWAGLFDLRENLLGRAQDDIFALAA